MSQTTSIVESHPICRPSWHKWREQHCFQDTLYDLHSTATGNECIATFSSKVIGAMPFLHTHG